jgi:hypothetical protein
MSEKINFENNQDKSGEDPKVKMLEALSKKQKSQSISKPSGPNTGLKIGVGQTAGSAPRLHRRKAGSQ